MAQAGAGPFAKSATLSETCNSTPSLQGDEPKDVAHPHTVSCLAGSRGRAPEPAATRNELKVND